MLDIFINMVQDGGMANKIKGSEDIRRLSVSFPHKIYDSIEGIAFSKKVSIAWVVRDAVETYIQKQEDNTNVMPDV
jgi:metal-responsive CopG/Arc/MetJ family transcriptional regulator